MESDRIGPDFLGGEFGMGSKKKKEAKTFSDCVPSLLWHNVPFEAFFNSFFCLFVFSFLLFFLIF